MGKSYSFGQPYVLFIMSICNFGCFPFCFRGHDLGSDCISSWSLLTFYFSIHSRVANSIVGGPFQTPNKIRYINLLSAGKDLMKRKREVMETSFTKYG